MEFPVFLCAMTEWGDECFLELEPGIHQVPLFSSVLSGLAIWSEALVARCSETLGETTLLIFDSFRIGFARQVASLSD